MNNMYKVMSVIGLTLFLNACSSKDKQVSYRSPLFKEKQENSETKLAGAEVKDEAPTTGILKNLPGVEFEINQGTFEDLSKGPNLSGEEELKIAIEKMPLPDFVHYTFGKLLGLNYIMNESLLADKSEVSLKVDNLISKQKLYSLVSLLLAEKKLSIEYDDGIVLIKESGDQKQSGQVAFGYGNKVEDIPTVGDKIVHMVPLEFAHQGRIIRILNTLMKIDQFYDVDMNSLVFTGNYQEIRRALTITKTLDIPSAKSRFINMFRLTFISPEEFITTVTTLLKKEGLNVGKENDGVLTFTQLPHLNAIIVHAANEKVLERLDEWRLELDVAGDTDDSKFFIYHSKYADVEDLGESLSQVLALKNNVSFGLQASNNTSNNNANSNNSNNNQKSGAGSRRSNSSVAVDDKRNTLTFYMTPAEYQSLLPIIEQLDVQAKQVVIEVTLMEVTLTGRLAYGLEWFITNSTENFGTKDGLGGVGSGFTYTLSKPGLDVLFNLRESENLVKLISNPTLMVTDGESASIDIGTDIPVLSGVVESESGSITQNVSNRTTGVSLSIGVQVASGNQVSLEVDQSLSEAGENELTSVDSPVVLSRKLKTKVTAKSGQTIILAGLISENKSSLETEVPVFGDIPVLGALFETNSKSDVRTELVVLITPRVIENDSDIDSITEALSETYKRLDFN